MTPARLGSMRASALSLGRTPDMDVVILLGAPGAGKGTQAPLLATRLGVPIVATGDLFRAAVRDGTPLGIEARRYMDAGQLVPDEITVRLLLDRLARADADGGVILDGFPRTAPQAEALDAALADRDAAVRVAVLVDVPTEELIRRMSGRWVCRAAGHPYHELFSPPHVAGICDLDGSELYQRSDDRPETIRARMAQQLGALGDVLDHYRASGVLRTVNGLRSIDEVADEVDAAVAEAGVAPHRRATRARRADARDAQVEGRGRQDALGRPDRRGGPRARRGEPRPRRLDGRARPPRRAPHPGRQGRAELPQLPRRRRYDARDPHAYPASTCISIDDEIVHGIPGDREIKAGQLVSVDVGVIYDDWHGDGARTFICGGHDAATPEARGLVDATRLSLMAGIYAAMPGGYIGDISAAVEDVAVAGGYGIIRQYVGHGIGTSMHEDPQVPNFRSRSKGIRLEPGLCLAIEPMLTLGSEATEVEADGWTVVTWDGSLAAHFEHTITIGADGPQILTTV